MKLKNFLKLTYYTFIFLWIIGCGKKTEIDHPTVYDIEAMKKNTINGYKERILSWEDKYGPRAFLRSRVIEFDNTIDTMRRSIDNNDPDLFNKNYLYLISKIEEIKNVYLVEFKYNNSEAFWILDQIITDLSKLENYDLEINKDVIVYQLLEAEEKLYSFIYSLNYTDKFIFNKMELIVNESKSWPGDTTANYYIGAVSYDSLKCNSISYWYEKNGIKTFDSTTCNYMRFPLGLGKVRIGGTLYLRMMDTVLPINFEVDKTIR